MAKVNRIKPKICKFGNRAAISPEKVQRAIIPKPRQILA